MNGREKLRNKNLLFLIDLKKLLKIKNGEFSKEEKKRKKIRILIDYYSKTWSKIRKTKVAIIIKTIVI